MTPISILMVVLIAAWRFSGVLCDPRGMEPPTDNDLQLTVGQGMSNLMFLSV